MFFIFFYIESCFILFKLAKEIEKTKIAYSFIENKDIFSPWISPLILMLFIKFYKQKGKVKGKISNIKGKIQIEVKDLIINHSESVSDSI